ncbi:hypothetical protein DFH06DRAFT_1348316 [Mycena polygramma]|nr:hypothetical protein DFH06DRAFT_1348316 [Mycena polygramma]
MPRSHSPPVPVYDIDEIFASFTIEERLYYNITSDDDNDIPPPARARHTNHPTPNADPLPPSRRSRRPPQAAAASARAQRATPATSNTDPPPSYEESQSQSQPAVARPNAPNALGTSPRPARRRIVAYVVFRGRRIGVFYSWHLVHQATSGLSFALQQGYASTELAIASFEVAQRHGWTFQSAAPSPVTLPRHAPLPIAPGDDLNAPGLFPREPNDPYYVVYAGINPGVFGTYLECALNVLAVPSSSHKRLPTYPEALRSFQIHTRGLSART